MSRLWSTDFRTLVEEKTPPFPCYETAYQGLQRWTLQQYL